MATDDASSAEMRQPFPGPEADPLALDEATVERLLSGELAPEQAPPGYAEVAKLLAATAAAPRHEELAGQAAALAELRAVTRARTTATRRTSKPRRRRRVGLAAVVVVGALATGGVAGAATGHLPGPVREAARSILVTIGRAEPATSVPLPATSARPPESGRAGQPRPPTDASVRAPGTTSAAAASPDLKGLCRAYLAGEGAENGKRLDATAFQALARAAGGEDWVQAYCERLESQDPEPDDTNPKDPMPKDQQPGAPDVPGQGQGGSPPSNGGGGQGNPQATRSWSR